MCHSLKIEKLIKGHVHAKLPPNDHMHKNHEPAKKLAGACEVPEGIFSVQHSGVNFLDILHMKNC